MKVVTAREIQALDQAATQRYGISGRTLMEEAGRAASARIRHLYRRGKVVVLAGGGKNGGDGLVAARDLFRRGWPVKVLFIAGKDGLGPECHEQAEAAKKAGVHIQFKTAVTEKDFTGAIVIDALLGTGLNKEITGPMARAIHCLNRSGRPVISLDIPSGVSSDNGQIMGIAVRAAYTVTFGLPKRGHFLYPGADCTGRLYIEPIGFPLDLLTSENIPVEVSDHELMRQLIPERPRYSHKGHYGHVFIIAGSRGKTGAAVMAAKASLRTGAGLVTVGVPESLMDVFQSRVTEEMTLPLPDSSRGAFSAKSIKDILSFASETADVIAIGPGIGVSADTRRLMKELILSAKKPLVIDADGINAINHRSILKKAAVPVILTPHPGEMARLLTAGRVADHAVRSRIEGDRVGTALSFSAETHSYLVLKGVPTVISSPEGRAYINPTGNPGMATAGAGDVLTGIIPALLAQGIHPLSASVLGTFLHGLAGDISARERGEHSLIASDIINALPAAFQALRQSAQ